MATTNLILSSEDGLLLKINPKAAARKLENKKCAHQFPIYTTTKQVEFSSELTMATTWLRWYFHAPGLWNPRNSQVSGAVGKALGMWHTVSLTNQLSSLTCADSRSELNMQKKLHRGEAD